MLKIHRNKRLEKVRERDSSIFEALTFPTLRRWSVNFENAYAVA